MFKKQNAVKKHDNEIRNEKTNINQPVAIYADFKPQTAINKNNPNKNKSNKNPQEQNKQDRNLNKNAKLKPNTISPQKKHHQRSNSNTNINKNPKEVNENKDNNENNSNANIENKNKIKNADFVEIVEKKLRDSSISKSQFNKKKEKKNDFLKSSINLNAEPELEPYVDNNPKTTINSNNKNKMNAYMNVNANNEEINIINNLMNPLTNFKNENNNINIMLNKPNNSNRNNINIRKSHNPNIQKFNEEASKNKNKEPYIIKEKEPDKNSNSNNNSTNNSNNNNNNDKNNNDKNNNNDNTNNSNIRKSSSKKSTAQNMQKNFEENSKIKRSINKKHTFQSQVVLYKDDKQTTPFTLERKKTLKNSSNNSSSLKSSIKDSLRRSSTFGRKSFNNNSINNVIIPLLNRTKENNCFLNVIIQILFHLGEFRKELIEVNDDLSNNSKTIKELYNLLKSYADEQVKNKDNKNPIEPILSVNDLRNYLNNIYKCYRPGETGDPMETMGYIFDLIHRIYNKKKKIDYKTVENCKCPSHIYFYLQAVDIITCPHCNVRKVQMFNKDCYMFNIFIKEISSKLHGKSFNSYKLKLFTKLKEYNETYENENKIKIPGCNCNTIMMSSYEKKLKLNGPSSPYLIINITWAEQFPSMLEILTAFALMPISENIENLFTFGEDIKAKINDIYYIKSVILYGIYHYVCIIYITDQKRWAIIDDKTIKYMKNYYELIDFLLRNHLMPVGLIYSKDRNDEIGEAEIKSNSLSKEEYLKLYQFCKDVDLRRGLKVSDLITSKGSFNENNQNYLNNNIFFRSIIDFGNDNNSNNRNNYTPSGPKKNEYFNPKTHIKQNNLMNIDNNDSNKNVSMFNKDNNTEIDGELLKGRKIMGDFSDKNMKGGILILSNSLNDNNEKSGQTKEESDLNDFGKNYVGDNEN